MSLFNDDEPWEYNRDYIHRDEVPNTDYMAEKLAIVVKQLYSRGALDKAALEGSLDELCDILNVSINVGDLQIERSGMLPAYLKPWFEFNRETLKKAQ